MYANPVKHTDASKSRKRGVGRLLREFVHATLDRLTLPERHAPPESYRFPWF